VVPVPPALVTAAGLGGADFTGAFAVPVPRGASTDARDWLAAFGPAAVPAWVRALMGVRTVLVRPLGLRTGPAELFPVLGASADTVVSGVDDRHLDFRLVLHVRRAAEGHELVAVTVVRRHNALGRAYVHVVRPFHTRVVPGMLRRMCSGRPPRQHDGVDADVRVAGPADLERLPAIEAAADALFASVGVTDLPPPQTAQQRAVAWRVLVVGDPVAGFAVLERVDGDVHLEQLSVHPSAGRRGLGTALLDAAVQTAREAGAARVTLTTYADVPWNAPWYAARGFTEVTDPGPELAALVAHEAAAGLAASGPRVVMARPLTPGRRP
jgi:GNAT superfamily N-acetyltransferase/plasmid stabilization system protein ParE